MIAIALVEKSCHSRSLYIDNRSLPQSYMEDFSILGIMVPNYHEARSLLTQSGFIITDRPGGGDISVEHVSEFPKLLTLLLNNGIEATMSDVADTMYQA